MPLALLPLIVLFVSVITAPPLSMNPPPAPTPAAAVAELLLIVLPTIW
jgi:hypothetical protein